jgi:hypothetical protein
LGKKSFFEAAMLQYKSILFFTQSTKK